MYRITNHWVTVNLLVGKQYPWTAVDQGWLGHLVQHDFEVRSSYKASIRGFSPEPAHADALRAAQVFIDKVGACRVWGIGDHIIDNEIRTMRRRDKRLASLHSSNTDVLPLESRDPEWLPALEQLLMLSSRCWTLRLLHIIRDPRPSTSKGRFAELYLEASERQNNLASKKYSGMFAIASELQDAFHEGMTGNTRDDIEHFLQQLDSNPEVARLSAAELESWSVLVDLLWVASSPLSSLKYRTVAQAIETLRTTPCKDAQKTLKSALVEFFQLSKSDWKEPAVSVSSLTTWLESLDSTFPRVERTPIRDAIHDIVSLPIVNILGNEDSSQTINVEWERKQLQEYVLLELMESASSQDSKPDAELRQPQFWALLGLVLPQASSSSQETPASLLNVVRDGVFRKNMPAPDQLDPELLQQTRGRLREWQGYLTEDPNFKPPKYDDYLRLEMPQGLDGAPEVAHNAVARVGRWLERQWDGDTWEGQSWVNELVEQTVRAAVFSVSLDSLHRLVGSYFWARKLLMRMFPDSNGSVETDEKGGGS